MIWTSTCRVSCEQLLHEDSGISERFKGFGASAFEGPGKFRWEAHDANAVTASSSSRFDEQRVAEAPGVQGGIG